MNFLSPLAKEKNLPYNFLAERLVLASILTNAEAIIIVSQQLSVEAFYIKSHQNIYQAALILYGEGKTIDYITITTWLQDQSFTNCIEDLSSISELLNQLITVGYLEDYIALIYEKYLRRLLISLGKEIVEAGYLTEVPFEEILATIEQKFVGLDLKRERKFFSTPSEVLQQILVGLKNQLKTVRLPGLASSFIELDSLTQGFHNSDLIILAGRPSMGKTAFSLALARNIALNLNLGIAFFSLEMTQEQLMYRLLSTETLISHSRLRAGRISKEEWILLKTKLKILATLPLYIDDSPTMTVSEIQLKTKKLKLESKEKTGLGLIIIDYLQLLEESETSSNRVQELSKITRNLKKLARELQLPIIVLSQISRAVESRTNKRPMLSDLRDSGSIEQDADLVMMLYRDNYYNSKTTKENILEIIIAKQRNGPVGTAQVRFDPRYLRFETI